MTLTSLLDSVVAGGLQGHTPSRQDSLAILSSTDEELLEVVAAAAKLRRHFFGNRVKLNFIISMKNGLCPEDCSYCAQRRGPATGTLTYNWIGPEEAAATADRAVSGGAKRICLVASGRGPSERDLDRIAATVGAIKARHPDVEICTSLGLLSSAQGERLRDIGVYAYNHNLNTPRVRYGEICTTHTYDDRVETVGRAQHAGLSPCSGAIFGMGESDEEIVDLALDLRRLDPDSVPVNFLIPFAGTPLGGEWQLTPQRCLRILALFRFVFPDVEVRASAGREIHLRTLQPLVLHLANSIFLGDYLAGEGQPGSADLEMIADAGFVVEGHEEATLPTERRDLVALRRRGPGTPVPANA